MKPELEAARPSTAGEEELQLQLALAMSKEEADADEKKRRTDQAKLEIALEESKRDQEVRTDTAMRSSASRCACVHWLARVSRLHDCCVCQRFSQYSSVFVARIHKRWVAVNGQYVTHMLYIRFAPLIFSPPCTPAHCDPYAFVYR